MTTQLSQPNTDEQPTDTQQRPAAAISRRRFKIVSGGIAAIAMFGSAVFTLAADTDPTGQSPTPQPTTTSVVPPASATESAPSIGARRAKVSPELSATVRQTGLPDGYWYREASLPDCHSSDRC